MPASLIRAAPAPVRTQRPSVNGQFVELNCQGPLPLFVVQTETGRVAFLMDDPKNIEINGSQDQVMDLNCGPQKPVSVRMAFDPPPADQQGVLGVARGISFGNGAAK